MQKCLRSLLHEITGEELAKFLGFRTPRAAMMFLNCKDTHMVSRKMYCNILFEWGENFFPLLRPSQKKYD